MLRNLEYFMAACEWAALSWRDLAVSRHRMKVFLASSSLFLRRSTPAACIHASRLPGARSWTLPRISRARSLSPTPSQIYSLSSSSTQYQMQLLMVNEIITQVLRITSKIMTENHHAITHLSPLQMLPRHDGDGSSHVSVWDKHVCTLLVSHPQGKSSLPGNAHTVHWQHHIINTLCQNQMNDSGTCQTVLND